MIAEQLDTFASATAMLAGLRERRISAVDLLELHARQIERYNPRLNALVIPNMDDARRAAQAADDRRARGEDAPLLGLPLSIKDCLDVAGLLCTAGMAPRAEVVAQSDARVVERARAAGAVILGKTNLPPAAGDYQTNNPIFGRTNNPWDLDRTPGGSTGGGAAAVAAGLSPLEIGTDIAGSIRVPAAFCGVYGHRPSETLVPRSGQVPGPVLPNPAKALNVQGPLARSAGDLGLLLDVIGGPDVGEDVAWRVQLPEPRGSRLGELRVAILPPLEWLRVDPAISAALEEVAGLSRRAGSHVGVAGPEMLGDAREAYRLYSRLLWAVVFAPRTAEERAGFVARMRASIDDHMAGAADAIGASVADYLGWMDQRERHRASWRAFFQDWDVLLSPMSMVVAFPHDESPERWSGTLDVAGVPVPYGRQSVYPSLASLPGHPATVFPAGFTASGLPIGLQAIGPYLEDRTPITFAELVGEATGGYRRPPGYD